jgi:hypothetical protein
MPRCAGPRPLTPARTYSGASCHRPGFSLSPKGNVNPKQSSLLVPNLNTPAAAPAPRPRLLAPCRRRGSRGRGRRRACPAGPRTRRAQTGGDSGSRLSNRAGHGSHS